MIEILLVLCRTLLYISIATTIGGLFFLIFAWPAGSLALPMKRFLKISAVSGVVVSICALFLQVPYMAGGSMAALFDAEMIGNMLSTKSGTFAVLRIVTFVLLTCLIAFGLKQRVDNATTCTSIALASVFLVATMSMSGHADNEGRLVLAIDMVHLLAASIWLGGLAVLLKVVIPTQESTDLAEIVPAFSSMAFSAVVALIVTGAYHGLVQVESLAGLADTNYGKILMVKMGAFAALIALGASSRKWVRRRYDSGMSRGRPRDALFRKMLKQTVAIEVAVAVVVLGLTAALVMTNPPAHESTLQASESVTDQQFLR